MPRRRTATGALGPATPMRVGDAADGTGTGFGAPGERGLAQGGEAEASGAHGGWWEALSEVGVRRGRNAFGEERPEWGLVEKGSGTARKWEEKEAC